MSSAAASGFLIRVPAGAAAGLTSERAGLRARGSRFELEPLFQVRVGSMPSQPGLAAREAAPVAWEWHLARPTGAADTPNAWDVAHALNSGVGLAAAGAPAIVEPDFVQEWPYENPAARGDRGRLAAAGEVCVFNDQLPELPHVDARFAWHLDDDRTQLRQARSQAGDPATRIRIAHLDTGYDSGHATFPSRVRLDLQRNFVDDQPPDDAHDPAARGPLENPGHGTGTLSILAGNRFRFSGGAYNFDDLLGGAPNAEIVPVRVGRSVVQLLTSNIAKGINYAVTLCASDDTRIHVLSMSMGGLASAAWADAVNMAYDAGIVFVAAAGNNFSAGLFGVPTHNIVYPARFRRVIAACGVMANRRPYYGLPFRTMQGNWGPATKMATAMSAFTPNASWAEIGCPGIVDMEGSGTSSATPQVAAAAALYLQRHAGVLFDPGRYPERWMCVEAARHALFTKADKSADGGSSEKLGNGILQAAAALSLAPMQASALHKVALDTASFPLLRVLTGLGAAPSPAADAMLALEATQLAHRWGRSDRPNPLEVAVSDPDLPADGVPRTEVRRLLDAILNHPDASERLKQRAAEARDSIEPGRPAPPKRKPTRPTMPADAAKPKIAEALPPEVPNPQPFIPPRPAYRCLRGYSIDPSLTTRLDTAPVAEITFKVPWESLDPGPIGEYLEVVDVDPASGCFYEPVDLNDASVLARDGLTPSEGTPQFHQQMVYAVASLTIRNFERALGRRSLWRPGPPPADANPKDDSVFVPRLRVYPHALREQNAFYSPQKIALLFGYFRAAEDNPADHIPGGMVFTCLSHDIVAHETTHALLDGMHRRFLNATNRDVRAFHEAFSDIVALLQHFTFPEILRHQISMTRGELRNHENVLGQLAGEFGRASGMRGALRDAIGEVGADGVWRPRVPDPAEYEQTVEPHARGAILVAAIFDAFLSIYTARTSDLLRLATGGSGVLEPGAIHPDLVGRLASEAAKAAQHVLTMCIRALDYCPPVDITFGEFLRALITADTDAVPDDDLHYRVALVEAFRRRGIYPRDLRTLSPDSLLWRTPEGDEVRPSQTLEDGLQLLQPFASQFLFAQAGDGTVEPREQVFHLQRDVRRAIHDWLQAHVRDHPDGANDAAFLGIDPSRGFEVHTARFALRPSPDGNIDAQMLLGILQEVFVPADPAVPGSTSMSIEGGATIIGDLRRLKIRYCVRKNVTSVNRQARQRAFLAAGLQSTRTTYFGETDTPEPFAAMHRGLER